MMCSLSQNEDEQEDEDFQIQQCWTIQRILRNLQNFFLQNNNVISILSSSPTWQREEVSDNSLSIRDQLLHHIHRYQYNGTSRAAYIIHFQNICNNVNYPHQQQLSLLIIESSSRKAILKRTLSLQFVLSSQSDPEVRAQLQRQNSLFFAAAQTRTAIFEKHRESSDSQNTDVGREKKKSKKDSNKISASQKENRNIFKNRHNLHCFRQVFAQTSGASKNIHKILLSNTFFNLLAILLSLMEFHLKSSSGSNVLTIKSSMKEDGQLDNYVPENNGRSVPMSAKYAIFRPRPNNIDKSLQQSTNEYETNERHLPQLPVVIRDQTNYTVTSVTYHGKVDEDEDDEANDEDNNSAESFRENKRGPANMNFLMKIIHSVQDNGERADIITSDTEIMTRLLSSKHYDWRVRPPGTNLTLPGSHGPVIVTVNMLIRSISKIDDVNMEYSVQLTFRESWVDGRLAYGLPGDSNPDFIILTAGQQIWKPDSFFQNEKQAIRHLIDKPNVLIRVHKDGQILYSVRLSLVLSCPMQLHYYPLDQQTCLIDLASYAYTQDDIEYRWKEIDPVQQKEGLESSLPSFRLQNVSTTYCTSMTNTGTYSCLRTVLLLKRQFSYYLLQLYIPSTMLVIVSWVSFWLDRTAVPARVTLGVTTLLTMTTQASGINAKLPPVSYSKAIDVWCEACLTFIFCALLEFAFVTYMASKMFYKNRRASSMVHPTARLGSAAPLTVGIRSRLSSINPSGVGILAKSIIPITDSGHQIQDNNTSAEQMSSVLKSKKQKSRRPVIIFRQPNGCSEIHENNIGKSDISNRTTNGANGHINPTIADGDRTNADFRPVKEIDDLEQSDDVVWMKRPSFLSRESLNFSLISRTPSLTISSPPCACDCSPSSQIPLKEFHFHKSDCFAGFEEKDTQPESDGVSAKGNEQDSCTIHEQIDDEHNTMNEVQQSQNTAFLQMSLGIPLESSQKTRKNTVKMGRIKHLTRVGIGIITRVLKWVPPIRWLAKQMAVRDPAKRADYISRILFPVAFSIFNIIYWIHYSSADSLPRL